MDKVYNNQSKIISTHQNGDQKINGDG